MDSVPKLMKLAQRDQRAGDVNSARARFEQVLKLKPRHLDANYLLGALLAEAGEYARAELHLKTALAAKPDSGYVLMNLGSLCRLTDRIEQALAYYERAAALLPNEPKLHLNLGSLEFKRGRSMEAANYLARYLASQPGDTAARTLFGDALRHLGQLDAAAREYQTVIDATGRTPVLDYMLRCCRGDSVEDPPQDYVCTLFDGYSSYFDRHLSRDLECRIPEAIHAAVLACSGADGRFARAVDLGCGTGLSGALWRDRCDWLGGVDLSAKMIAIARAKAIFDRLDVADLRTWLSEQETPFDLAIAGDVLVYIGDLSALFGAVASRLASGGLFAFSAEEEVAGSIRLRASGRFAHSRDYVKNVAAAQGLRVLRIDDALLRKEGSNWVPGFIGVLARA